MPCVVKCAAVAEAHSELGGAAFTRNDTQVVPYTMVRFRMYPVAAGLRPQTTPLASFSAWSRVASSSMNSSISPFITAGRL